MIRIKYAAVLVAVIVLFSLIAGCTGKQLSPDSEVQLYKALKASAATYSTAREALRQWDKIRPFSDEEKARIEAYAKDYRLAYHMALEAWDLWKLGEASEITWIQAANEALDMLSRFERMVPNE